MISLYKQRTENLCKLENAEVVRAIPELDASPNVDDGVGSKTGLEGTVEIKVTLAKHASVCHTGQRMGILLEQ